MKKILILIVLPLLSACHSGKQVAIDESKPKEDVNISQDLKNTIVFLSFSIQKKDNLTHITLLNKKETNGRLKDIKPFIKNENIVLKAVYYNTNIVLGETLITHPLMETVEYPNEKGTGFEQTTLTRDSSSFFLRAQFEQTITSIKFSEIIDGDEIQLNTIQL